jgi:hypothetical protein
VGGRASSLCEAGGGEDGAGTADAVDAFAEGFLVAEDADLDAEEVNGDVGFLELRKADGVFLGGDDEIEIAVERGVDAGQDFFFGVAVMIGVSAGEFDLGAEFAEAVLEAFRDGDAGDGAHVFVFQKVEGFAFPGEEIFEVEGLVGALDDFGGAVIEADALNEFVVGFAVAFGDEDVTGAVEVLGRFAEGAPGEKVFVSEGGVTIDEDNIEAMAEAEVLEAVIEEDGIDLVFADGGEPALHAVLVDEDDDVLEVIGEHVRFVAGGAGVEEKGFAVGDEARGVDAGFALELGFEALAEGWFDAFVTAAEDGDGAAAFGEGFSEFFDDGGFAGATDGEVADGDDEAAEVAFAEDAIAVEVEAEADDAAVEVGEGVEDGAEGGGTGAFAAFKDDVDGELFEIFFPLTHKAAL